MKIEPNSFIETIFSKKCGRLYVDPTDGDARKNGFREKTGELLKGHAFVECIIPGNALDMAALLFKVGFSLVCIQPVFEVYLDDLGFQKPGNIHTAMPAEHKAIIQTAGVSFCFDRYSQDRRISRTHTETVYSQWVRNSLSGRADFVMTNGQAFCSGKITGRDGWIELIAVPEDQRKKGIGGDLVRASLYEFKQRGCLRSKVKTELLNVNGVRLYESLGFKLSECFLALHWHSD